MINNLDNQYKKLLAIIVNKPDGITNIRDTRAQYSFNKSIIIDLTCQAFPSLTLRNIYPKSALQELHWLLNGQGQLDNIKSKTMRAIWADYADSSGRVCNSYYDILRNYDNQDQLATAVAKLKANPMRRDVVISMFKPGLTNQPPCQSSLIFSSDGAHLDFFIAARSCDLIFGFPSDIQVFAALFKLIADKAHLIPRKLVFHMINAHIYIEHLNIAERLLSQPSGTPATVYLETSTEHNSDFDFDFKVVNYVPMPFDMASAKVNIGNLAFYSN